jgi:iron complex outermembrane receptor protein
MDKKSSGKIFSSAVLILSGILFFARPEPALAQFEEEEFFKMDEWVETASKRLQRIEEAPAAVTLITEDEIRQSGATNLGDLLRRVPGLEVMALGPSDFEVGARGMNKPLENGVLVLVNGRSIYWDFFGIVLWNKNTFPLESIAKIEVVRGPGSVLYGANAMHAVVNIITKAPGESPGTLLSLTAGPRSIISTIMESGSAGKVSHSVSAGWTQFSSYEDRDDIMLRYPRGKFSLLYDLGKQGNVQMDAGVESGSCVSFYDSIGWIRSFSSTQNFLFKYSRPDFYFRAFWNKMDSPLTYVPETLFPNVLLMKTMGITIPEDWQLEMDLENNVVDLETQKIFELWKGQVLTLGGNYRYNTIDSSVMPEYKTQNLLGAYLQHEFRFRDMLTSYLGARYDYHPVTGNNYSPRGSLLYSPFAGHTFRVSAGKSFRNPTLVETYANIGIPFSIGSATFGGNPEMSPEELLSGEVGYHADLFRGMIKGSFVFFYNWYSNMTGIAYPEGVLKFKADFENMYNEESRGIEAEVKASPYSWLIAFANYSFTDVIFNGYRFNGKMYGIGPELDNLLGYEFGGRSDRRTPRHKINAGVTASLKNGISATALVHYVGSTNWPPNLDRGLDIFPLGPLPAYTLVNLRVGYRFFRDQVEVAVSAANLLPALQLADEHKEFPRYAETIGTQVNGSVRVNF